MSWSSQQYLKFEDERTRPARDLLNAVPTLSVKTAADLGCGPGNSTELVAARYPDAKLVGVDNSPEMIKAAEARLPKAKFALSKIEDWSEPGPWDLLFANASLQWVGHHEALLPKLVSGLAPGGVLAIQMPDNLDEPSNLAMRQTANTMPFSAKLRDAEKARTILFDASGYYKLLKPLCTRVDVWKTTYFHPLAGGVAGIVEWVRGTALIPYLKPLSKSEQAAYLNAYRDALAKAFVPLADGTVILPFPRLFIVATR
jgi:trans-aconitate 2-methyltransferase